MTDNQKLRSTLAELRSRGSADLFGLDPNEIHSCIAIPKAKRMIAAIVTGQHWLMLL